MTPRAHLRLIQLIARNLLATITVTTAKDNLPNDPVIDGSLRDALQQVRDGDTIDFAIGNGGPVVIFPTMQLPTLARSGVTIDGRTQGKLWAWEQAGRLFYETGTIRA